MKEKEDVFSEREESWQDETALQRFKLISPLLEQDLDSDTRIAMRKRIAEKEGITVRSMYRYEAAYRKGGFSALRPKSRKQTMRSDLPENFNELLEEAIQLKREVPSRSVSQIILILEMEDRVAPGVLKRSTLQRHLYDAGFGRKQMKKYAAAEKSSGRRFCKTHRMMLAQADIKYVMKLPIGPDRKMIQCYVCSIIDDHSKLILASGVYDNQESAIVEDVYRKAILSYGLFDATYVDNGKQFVSKELIDALSRLGIRHLQAPPYSGKSKGKIEKFNGLIDSYIRECRAQKVETLEEAQRYWDLFVEEYYHDKPHEGIREYYESKGIRVPAEGITPRQEFNRDSRNLRFPDAKLVGRAFLHHETRKIDAGACFSFQGRKYAVPAALIGAEVRISFDPMDVDTIIVDYPGTDTFMARSLMIGDYVAGEEAKMPEHMLKKEPESSRFLKGLEKKHSKRQKMTTDAISFGDYRKEVRHDV